MSSCACVCVSTYGIFVSLCKICVSERDVYYTKLFRLLYILEANYSFDITRSSLLETCKRE